MSAGLAPAAVDAGRPRFPLFDSLRAVAAIAILVVHTSIFAIGFDAPWYKPFVTHLDIGVPFFFLLSAFLLYRPYVAARIVEAPRTGFSIYLRRRFLRILPAYWAALTVAAVVPGLAGAFSSDWWVYYGLLQNYPIYDPQGTCAVDYFRCGNPPTWSLAIEIGFYVTLPLYVLAMDRLARSRSWLRTELLAAGILAAVSVVIQSLRPTSDLLTWLFYSPLGRGWWFGLGLALAALSVWGQRRRSKSEALTWVRGHPGPLLWAAAALYVLCCLAFPDTSAAYSLSGQAGYVAQYLIFGLIAALLMLPAAFGDDGPGLWRRFLRHRSLAWLGLVSYGIFLWQFPVLILLVDHTSILDLWPAMDFLVLMIATLAGTILCATASYYGLERPLKRRYGRGSQASGIG